MARQRTRDTREMREMTSGSATAGSRAASLATARVVDFDGYRHARAQLALPLAAQADVESAARPAMTSRGVAHRRRMLAHLGAMLSGCRT